MHIRQANGPGELLGRLGGGCCEQPGEKGSIGRLEVTAQFGADQRLDRPAGEVIDLAGSEANGAVSVEKHEHTWDRRQQVSVDAENLRPWVDRIAHVTKSNCRRGKRRATPETASSTSPFDPEQTTSCRPISGGQDVCLLQVQLGPMACALVQAWRTASASISSLTLGDTTNPPVSSAALKLTPKSLRSISPEAVNSRRWLPHGSWMTPSNWTSRTTGRVTPWMVSSPV